MILKKQILSQRGPVGTGQKSSDGKVSGFVIPCKKEVFFEKSVSKISLTFSSMNAYIAYVKQLSV